MYLKAKWWKSVFAIQAAIKHWTLITIRWEKVNGINKIDEQNIEQNIKGPVYLLWP